MLTVAFNPIVPIEIQECGAEWHEDVMLIIASSHYWWQLNHEYGGRSFTVMVSTQLMICEMYGEEFYLNL